MAGLCIIQASLGEWFKRSRCSESTI